MNYKPIIAVVVTLLLASLGCGNNATPVNVGPFSVDGDTGVATGQAFGIKFNTARGTKVEVISVALDSSGTVQRAAITLADDLRIDLQTVEGAESATFQLNGRQFGILQAGDAVGIDEERNVTVNGDKRTAMENPSE